MKAATLKTYFETNVYFPKGSFISHIYYDSTQRELTVTFAKGQVYRFHKFQSGNFVQILTASNMGSFMVHNVLTGRKEGEDFTKLETLPPAHVEQIRQQHFKFSKFLAR